MPPGGGGEGGLSSFFNYLGNQTSPAVAIAKKALEHASQKARRLYEAFHLEVQYDLEWASSRSYEDS